MRTHWLSCTGCEVPHFLKSCFLCHKPLDNNNDIFMYRGDTPFCSQECRQEQIEIDEGSEKNWSLSSSKRSATKPGNKSSASSKGIIRLQESDISVEFVIKSQLFVKKII